MEGLCTRTVTLMVDLSHWTGTEQMPALSSWLRLSPEGLTFQVTSAEFRSLSRYRTLTSETDKWLLDSILAVMDALGMQSILSVKWYRLVGELYEVIVIGQ